jgi:hypothetical protein
MAKQTRFESDTCGRCGGSGSYSFNLMHGSMCYGCNGAGYNLTKRASKALAVIGEHRAQPVENVNAGDLIRYRSMSGAERTVQVVDEPHEGGSGFYGHNPDGSTNYDDLTRYTTITLSYGKPETRQGVGVSWKPGSEHTVRVVVSDELQGRVVDLALELQNLLTKQATVRKDSAERALEIENEMAEIYGNPANRINKPVVMPVN